jgi:predicted regulator of Ras-like GTPase activity (Roadblock/LC7/MglB family)
VLKQKTSDSQDETAVTNSVASLSVGGENSAFASLSASLEEIRKLKGVIGYIIRSNCSAVVDLTEPDKISEYALLTSEIHESCENIKNQFNLGETETAIIEGKNVKVLCLSVGENRISVLMEKDANHAWIIKRILL